MRPDLAYRVSNGHVVRQWIWRSGLGGREGYAGASDSLRKVLARNPTFKISIVHGVTDLVTPYLTSRYVVGRLPTSLTAGRVTLGLLPGGHMMYLRAASRAALHEEAAKLHRMAP
ncbi:MAG: hypothetical protein KIS73_22265 [Enhydrobacter sp.]|nr:hypothetical protein [Enhydrobacter sp.]